MSSNWNPGKPRLKPNLINLYVYLMLLRLYISNFYSIADEVVLYFAAAGKKTCRQESHTLDFNGNRYVNIIGLFGSNAAGKSNLIKAVNFFRNLVLTSTNNNEGFISGYEPFKFEMEKPSKLRLDFEWEGIEYEYSIEIYKDCIRSESLYHYPQKRRAKIFERRDTDTYSFGKGLIQRPAEIEMSTGPQTLFLSRGNSMNRPVLKKVYRFFRDGMWVENGDYRIDSDSRKTIESHKSLLLKALEISDSDIIDFNIVESLPGIPVMQTFHRENPNIPFDFISEESEGTRRLFHILLMLIDKAQDDVTIFFDEFDLKLHLKLSEFILDVVSSFGKAQMVFTSHNPALLNRERLNDEQIVFVTKLPNGVSDFVPLYDYSGISKIKDLQKAYLQGRFDGVPYLGSVEEIKS